MKDVPFMEPSQYASQNIGMEEYIQKLGFVLHTTYGGSMLPLLREQKDVTKIERCDPTKLNKYDVVIFRKH